MPGDKIKDACVYFAPSGYHLLVEEDKIFSLSVDPPVQYAIPSIDVLFETAADAYEDRLVGVLLTGANCDGTDGLKKIRKYGGLTIVQDPATAEAPTMPRSAIDALRVDYILPLAEIGPFLRKIRYA